VPQYAARLEAFHCSCRPELAAVLGKLQIPPGAQVLDAPCGDGFFSALLAARLGPIGTLVGVDICPALLRRANRRCARQYIRGTTHFQRADIYNLPFAEGTFDLVFCAHSLISLPDPIGALTALRRVVRPGGRLLVLETDEMHHLLLPWPAQLELQIQEALLEATESTFGDGVALNPARFLVGYLRAAGFTSITPETHTVDRLTPLPTAFRRFVSAHLRELLQLARPYLSPAGTRAFLRFLGAEGTPSPLDQPGNGVTCLFRSCLATR
jgi:ubiquinone/menaquinone biosynthesis C-methylase UbiE